jgi:hypothetical protein
MPWRGLSILASAQPLQTRFRAPQPCAGLLQKSLWDACEPAAEARPTPPSLPHLRERVAWVPIPRGLM